MAETVPILEMSDVGRVVDGTVILDEVDWTINPGERWVVLGPNGSGKTTLAQIAALRLHPSGGAVTVLGVTLGRADIGPLLPRVGFASAALADQIRPDLSARDVVMTAKHGALETWWHDYDQSDAEVAERSLERAGVSYLAGQRFGACSSGERQRVLIARALMTNPALLVLDEPTAALDLAGREQFVLTLERIAAEPESPAMVLITHHVDEIPPSFSHGLIMASGNVRALGAIDTVLTSPLLSESFGLPLEISRRNNRWTARAT